MDKQRGGAFRVSGYIALALLALAVLEAAEIRHLLKHRNIEIYMKQVQEAIQFYSTDPADDYGVVHTFPPKRQVCTYNDTICYNRI
jgi:hypothetical protein